MGEAPPRLVQIRALQAMMKLPCRWASVPAIDGLFGPEWWRGQEAKTNDHVHALVMRKLCHDSPSLSHAPHTQVRRFQDDKSLMSFEPRGCRTSMVDSYHHHAEVEQTAFPRGMLVERSHNVMFQEAASPYSKGRGPDEQLKLTMQQQGRTSRPLRIARCR